MKRSGFRVTHRKDPGWRKTPVLDRILSPIQAQGWGGAADESVMGVGFSPGCKCRVVLVAPSPNPFVWFWAPIDGFVDALTFPRNFL